MFIIMCGIAAAVNCADRETVKHMLRVQAHRGPDSEELWEYRLDDGGWVALGARRLAILDLSPAGNMPMSTPDGMLTIAYNGEIYNYPQLRRQLEDKGCRFRSTSDTEAILYLYQELGPECVRYLNGMFALVLWDQKQQQLFLARDHFGVKPLYYWHHHHQLLCASEMKAILQYNQVPRRLDKAALHKYLTFLWTPDTATLFEGVLKFPPGHYGVFRDGVLHLQQYWDLALPPAGHHFPRGEDDLAAELRARFMAVVKSQMLSDVPLGAFLSAGLDSSGIVASMMAAGHQPPSTFTIAFRSEARRGEITLDDPRVAARTAEHYRCKHTEILLEPDVVELLPRLIWHMDEPTADPAMIAAYLVSREARRAVTVLLSGVGGDELFAGYRKYQAHYLAKCYQLIPFPLRRFVLEPGLSRLPVFRNSALKGYMRLAKKMTRSGSLPFRDRFIADGVYLNAVQKERLYTEQMRSQTAGLDPYGWHLQCFEKAAHADFLNQMLYVDMKTFLVSLNLAYNDKMSMACSVEVRVPYLDREFAEWVMWNVPPEMKLKNGTTKFIFRRAMHSLLPAEVMLQKKAGFGVPLDRWLANDLYEMTNDLLSPDRVKQRQLFQPSEVRRLLDEHRTGREEWSMQLW